MAEIKIENDTNIIVYCADKNVKANIDDVGLHSEQRQTCFLFCSLDVYQVE